MSDDDQWAKQLSGEGQADDRLAALLRERVLERQSSTEAEIPESAIERGRERLRFITRSKPAYRQANFLSGIAAGVIATWAAGIFLMPLFETTPTEPSAIETMLASKSLSNEAELPFASLVTLLEQLERARIPYVLAHEDKRSTITFRLIRSPRELETWLAENGISASVDDTVRLQIQAAEKEIP
ncbi:MAG: hypothetical protein AAGC71_11885 [Pseudomonadota bacterium]